MRGLDAGHPTAGHRGAEEPAAFTNYTEDTEELFQAAARVASLGQLTRAILRSASLPVFAEEHFPPILTEDPRVYVAGVDYIACQRCQRHAGAAAECPRAQVLGWWRWLCRRCNTIGTRSDLVEELLRLQSGPEMLLLLLEADAEGYGYGG